MVLVLDKLLDTPKSLSQLQLNGIKVHKTVVDSLCKLMRVRCLSGLIIGDMRIGTEGAI